MSRAVLSFLDTCSRSPATVSVVSAPRTARERARVELTNEIKQEARRQLAEQGAAALSLRAVARELGMVSSALYRYFPSRDDLLTALILDAYASLAEAADAATPQTDPYDRWRAVCRAVRAWAVAHPHEYALIYGSPVPGYEAPPETVEVATRVALILVGLIRQAWAGGTLAPAAAAPPMSPVLAEQTAQLAAAVAPELPGEVLARALVAWTQLF